MPSYIIADCSNMLRFVQCTSTITFNTIQKSFITCCNSMWLLLFTPWGLFLYHLAKDTPGDIYCSRNHNFEYFRRFLWTCVSQIMFQYPCYLVSHFNYTHTLDVHTQTKPPLRMLALRHSNKQRYSESSHGRNYASKASTQKHNSTYTSKRVLTHTPTPPLMSCWRWLKQAVSQ